MVHILKSDYETITAECPHCRTTSVYSRISDIGDVGPYAGRDISCLSCGRDFWISMDTVGPLYQKFVHAADEHFKRKHYMRAVASLGQAWELFFAAYAEDIFLYRPFFAAHPCESSVDELNCVAEMLAKEIRRFAFQDLRNLFAWITIKSIHPQTLAESVTAIARINLDNLNKTPPEVSIQSITDKTISAHLLQLLDLKVLELRNRVLHKRAYRPSRSETEQCLEEEVIFMFSLNSTVSDLSFADV